MFSLSDMVKELSSERAGDELDGEHIEGIVGLNLAGTTFYTLRTTLTYMTDSYFKQLIEGDKADALFEVDKHGHEIFFIDRDPELFKYILQYLRKLKLNLPPFSNDPALWRDLRDEAIFYGLEGLSQQLQVTHTCEPNEERSGVFYWLGTRRGLADYQNPHALQFVRVGFWFDRSDEGTDGGIESQSIKMERRLVEIEQEFRQNLIQHKTKILGYNPDTTLNLSPFMEPSWLILNDSPDSSSPATFITFDLKTISVCPTHFSLSRWGVSNVYCKNFDLEGSVDGVDWKVLHRVRNDLSCRFGNDSPEIKGLKRLLKDNVKDKSKWNPIIQKYAETYYQKRWEITPAAEEFYRYFRLIRRPREYTDEADGGKGLYIYGFEIYGDVYES